jgi:hypothetical protein
MSGQEPHPVADPGRRAVLGETMVCRCCGLWRVEQIDVRTTYHGRPVMRLRVTYAGHYRGDVASPAQVAQLGVPLHQLTPDSPAR